MKTVCVLGCVNRAGNGHVPIQLVGTKKKKHHRTIEQSLSKDVHQAIPAKECILRKELRMWTKILQQDFTVTLFTADVYCDIVYSKKSYLETFSYLFLRGGLNKLCSNNTIEYY